jgi:hypothetical protein
MDIPSISATLKFLKWQKLYEIEKPFQIFINIPAHVKDQRTTNLVYEDVQVDINDVRTSQTSFELDKQGFTYLKHETKVQDFTQRTVVEQQYLPEVEQLIRSNVEDVDRVHFFDWRVSQYCILKCLSIFLTAIPAQEERTRDRGISHRSQ